ncbi:Dyp-type peroxidase [Endozoicomonadaceae bacterium StTr2]
MPTPQSGITPEANTDALFITLLANNDTESLNHIRQQLATIPALTETLATQHPDARLSSTVSIGSLAWDSLYPQARPTELKPFQAIREAERLAPATPGDIFLHIRSNRKDLNFELASIILDELEGSVMLEEEITGFRYMDSRDMTGFVDGTENPEGDNRALVALVGDQDSAFTGGSYISLQRYVHDMVSWNHEPVEYQEQVIGRTKQDNIEFSAEQKAPTAHIKRVNLKDEQGRSREILRHSMPYGDMDERGLFFIAYARTPSIFNDMLAAMMQSDAHGHYDHLMNYTTAVTGGEFFAPSIEFLQQNTGPVSG